MLDHPPSDAGSTVERDHRWTVFLRLFAATSDPSIARDLAGEVAAKMGRFGGVKTQPVERYWKIPEYHEVKLELRPDLEAIAAYEGVLGELATEWERHGSQEEPWAIWNPSAEGRCFSPLVTWMSLDLVNLP